MNTSDFVVDTLGVWHDDLWRWQLRSGSEVLDRYDMEELVELEELLTGIAPRSNHQDRFVWPYDNSNCFTIKSCYASLNVHSSNEDEAAGGLIGMRSVWQEFAPSKLKIFGWRLLRDRLPTCKQLLKRNIIHLNDSYCVLCQSQLEDHNHVFLNCLKVDWLWMKVFSWLNV